MFTVTPFGRPDCWKLRHSHSNLEHCYPTWRNKQTFRKANFLSATSLTSFKLKFSMASRIHWISRNHTERRTIRGRVLMDLAVPRGLYSIVARSPSEIRHSLFFLLDIFLFWKFVSNCSVRLSNGDQKLAQVLNVAQPFGQTFVQTSPCGRISGWPVARSAFGEGLPIPDTLTRRFAYLLVRRSPLWWQFAQFG